MKNFNSRCLVWWCGKEQTAGGVGDLWYGKEQKSGFAEKNCASRIFDGVPLYAEELFFYFSQR